MVWPVLVNVPLLKMKPPAPLAVMDPWLVKPIPFVLIYLICVALIGIPIMMSEIMIGRAAQKQPVAAFHTLQGRKTAWAGLGWLGVFAGFIILSYYVVIAGWATTVFLFLDVDWLKVHVVVMGIGQCGTGFFAVWTVHHDCDESHHIARTQRGRFKNWISYNMFFHVEHHLFPAVPTCHLPELSRRLDRVAPELQEKNVY